MWTEKYVIKRKGTYRPFEFYKIEDAVQQEFLSEERPVDPQVWETILHELQTHEVWAVEDIQNLIEWTLFDSGEFDVLRPFMLYRHNRKMQREHIHKLNQYTTYIDSTQTIEEYIQETDWRINANANTSYSNARLVNNTAGKVIANYWLDKVYSPLGAIPIYQYHIGLECVRRFTRSDAYTLR